jgi:surface polysaccharide O-acyltransferase-like enzyme
MLDVCRLLAAYAIVWLHTPRPVAWADASLVGRFAVPFFTAAATLFAWQAGVRSQRGVAEYTRSRLTRIYVPFLAWSCIYLVFKGAKALLLPGEPNDFPGIEFLWLGSFYHLWFMPFILLVTLAVFCLGRCANNVFRQTAVFVAALVVGGLLAWWPADDLAANASFAQLALDALPSACWAVALAIIYTRGGSAYLSSRRVSAVCLAAAVALTILLCDLGRNRLIENLSGVALLLFALGNWTSPFVERLARLGSLAYGIYLSHLLFVKVFEAVGAKLHLPVTLATSLGIFVLAAAGSTLLAWTLNRWRWTRWLTAG